MFTIDDDDIVKLELKLRRVAERALPFATKQTVNSVAFAAREEWQGQIREKMITRNKFTERSIRVEQTKTLNIGRQEATVGSVADYMDEQEFGGVKTKKGKHGTPITTSVASGEGEGARPRRRVARRPNRVGNIRLKNDRNRAATRRQQTVIAIKQAVENGDRFVFLDLQRSKGIYRITGGKRNPQIKLLHDLSRSTVRIPARPTLGPAVRIAQRRLPEIYAKALRFQLARLK